MKVDSGAEANIITETCFRTMKPKPKLHPSTAQLKPYGSPPLPTLGQFTANISANSKTVQATVYVTKGNTQHSLLSKYTAFDLGILQITTDNTPLPINVHNMDVVPKAELPTTNLGIHDVKHMGYEEMSNTLTPAEKSIEFLNSLNQQTQSATMESIVNNFQSVFQGIGKHRYRQVQLIIDQDVKPIIQPQRKIPFAKRDKLDTILDELEQAGVIENVEGPTDWISNLVLTPKADPREIRMNIDMTTANRAIRRTRPTLSYQPLKN